MCTNQCHLETASKSHFYCATWTSSYNYLDLTPLFCQALISLSINSIPCKMPSMEMGIISNIFVPATPLRKRNHFDFDLSNLLSVKLATSARVHVVGCSHTLHTVHLLMKLVSPNTEMVEKPPHNLSMCVAIGPTSSLLLIWVASDKDLGSRRLRPRRR